MKSLSLYTIIVKCNVPLKIYSRCWKEWATTYYSAQDLKCHPNTQTHKQWTCRNLIYYSNILVVWDLAFWRCCFNHGVLWVSPDPFHITSNPFPFLYTLIHRMVLFTLLYSCPLPRKKHFVLSQANPLHVTCRKYPHNQFKYVTAYRLT